MTTIRFHHTKKNPLIIPALIAVQTGIFQKRGLNVILNLTEDFTFDGNSPFLEGTSDAMIGDLTFFFYLLEQGKKAVLTSNLTRTIKLVGRNGIKEPFEGMKIGVNRKGLFRLYKTDDLKTFIPNPQIVWLNNSYDRIQALATGDIDALVAIEPFVTDLVEQGHTILWDSKNSTRNLVMWAFDENFYTTHPEAVTLFHESLEEAAQLFNHLSPEEKVTLCAKDLGYNDAFAKRMAHFQFEEQTPVRLEDFNFCMEWMYDAKEISNHYKGENLIKPQALKYPSLDYSSSTL